MLCLVTCFSRSRLSLMPMCLSLFVNLTPLEIILPNDWPKVKVFSIAMARNLPEWWYPGISPVLTYGTQTYLSVLVSNCSPVNWFDRPGVTGLPRHVKWHGRGRH